MLGKLSLKISDLLTRLKAVLSNVSGLVGKTDYFHALPMHHEQRAERLIAVMQFMLVLTMIAVEGLGSAGSEAIVVVIALLGAFWVSSALRWKLTSRDDVPDKLIDALTVVDVGIFLSIATILQTSTAHSQVNIAPNQIALWLGLLIAMRMVRIHPRPLIIAGGFGLVGLVVAPEVISAAAQFGNLGEEFRANGTTLLILFLFISLMVYATWQARKTMLYLNSTLENMPHGVALFDHNNCLVVSNSQYSRLYGLTDEHRKRGTSISDLIRWRHQAGCFGEVEYQSHASNWMNSFEASEPSTQVLDDGRVFSILRQKDADGRTVTTTEDVTTQRRLEARVEYLAYHDSLTGLANRAQLRERLEAVAKQNRRHDQVTAFCLDLDRFKEINDTLGHDVGDDLLKAVGQRLKRCVRESNLIARTGGDEFVILQVDECSLEDTANFAQRMIDVLMKPYQLRGYQVQIGVSIGVAFLDEQVNNVHDVVKNADVALYRAKTSGRGSYCFYDESMGQRLQERRTIENDLRQALANGEFELHYQPIVNADSGYVESMEALIRWRHPARGLVSPGEFIPIVDETGLAVSVGEWVIEQACMDAAAISDNIKVSVNVSAAQFHKPGLADTVATALRSSKLSAQRLEIEITETVLLENSDTTIKTLKELHQMGVRIALDDFGTGYSSLGYLQKFSFDRLKIDRSFVKDSLTNGSSGKIIKSVIELGQRLGMEITAEGVETDEQLVRVTADGCTAIQGFLISRPLPIMELNKFLLAEIKHRAGSQHRDSLRQTG